MKRSLAVFFGRLFTKIYFGLRLYNIWSHIYRWLWERNQLAPLARYADMNALVALMDTCQWRPDGLKELGDAVSNPLHVQWIINNTKDRYIGDCDEFAIYESSVVNNELKDNPEWSGLGILKAQMMTIMWYGSEGYDGHNVCLYTYNDGTVGYMDYGYPEAKQKTIADVDAQVRANYAPGSDSLGWVVSNCDLSLDKKSW